jgi:hypothetical protein
MSSELIMTVFGSFVSLLLVINAFFTRKTLETIAKIDMNLAVYMTKHDTTEEISRWNREEILRIRDRVHSVEGGQAQVLQYLKEQNNKER